MRKNKKNRSLKLPNWLIVNLIPEKFIEEFQGDLQEIYEERQLKAGKLYAGLMYWIDALHLLIGFSSWHLFKRQQNPTTMFKHYLTIANRNLLKNTTYSIINISGLTIGMGVCLVIFQYIYFELGYDKFHRNAKNIYRLTQTETRNGEIINTGVFSTYALGPSSKEQIPEVKEFVRIRPDDMHLVISNPKENISYQEDKICFVDSNYLKIFNFPLKLGDKRSALSKEFNIVITELAASKYFGDSNPIGQILSLHGGGWLSGDFVVTGILKELPDHSHLQFDVLIPMEFLLKHWMPYKEGGGWAKSDFVTYLTLFENVDKKIVGEKISKLTGDNMGKKLSQSNSILSTELMPIADIHLNSESLNEDYINNKGSAQNILFFGIIAIFILFMAWINNINLSTAHAINRTKEVGIRKTIGAVKTQLINQFFLESVVMNAIAAVAALGFAYLTVPILSTIIGKELELTILQHTKFWAGFLMFILVGSLISGLYPAFILSSFKPISVFKSAKTRHSNKFNLRKGLIVFQFFITTLLISGTYLIYQQVKFMMSRNLGIDMKKILVLNGPRVILETLKEENTTLGAKYQVFKTKTTRHHSISDVSATVTVPGKGYLFTMGMRRIGEPAESEIQGSFVLVDTDFPKTFDMEFLAEADYTTNFSPDERVIVNEEALKALGFNSATEALHEKLTNGNDSLEIVGIVKNIHWNSLRDNYLPIFYVLNNQYGAYLSLKIDLSNVQETLSYIESSYHEVFPNDPFHYFFLEDEFNAQYHSDLQFGKLFFIFSLLAIAIACIGLFALVSYSTTQRIKEIGIRKVFGANVGDLMMLLSREYFTLLSIAIVIAIPFILYWSKAWLDNYAFKTKTGLDLLLAPTLALILISVITVSYRTYTTAKSNPIKSIRLE